MSRFDLTRHDLAEVLDGEPPYRVEQLWAGIHRLCREPVELTELPTALRSRLQGDRRLALSWGVAGEVESDAGETVKWLLEAEDGARVETVLMHYPDRTTVCVSSQAGCAMGCSFCATGQLGFGRQLSVGEIVEQVARATRAADERGFGRLDHVVFMGMGEPLANPDRLFEAIRRLQGDLGIGSRSITVSTVGVVPGIRRLAAEAPQVNLAVSLHAGNDELRSSLVPLNERYPLGALLSACEEYCEATHRRLSFEWALISGVNDRPSDARELGAHARRLGAHVNLIPLNPTPGYLVAGSSKAAVRAFRDRLRELGVNVTVRDTRGQESDAACGQLAAGLAPGVLRPGRRSHRSIEVATSPRLA